MNADLLTPRGRAHPIPASWNFAAPPRQRWDVVVIGAGPAGALAAREVARLGHSVLLVDKSSFPRWKVCGCCLNQRALGTLEAVGLGRLAASLGAAPLHSFQLAGWKRQAIMPLPGGVSLSREAFDAALVRAAIDAGAEFLPSTQASLAVAELARVRDGHLRPNSGEFGYRAVDELARVRDERRIVQLRQGDRELTVEATLVLAANGLGGKLLVGEEDFEVRLTPGSRIGAGTIAEEAPDFYGPGTIYMACAEEGYVGLVRLEDGRLDIAAAFDADGVRQAGGLGAVAAAILDNAGFPSIKMLTELSWRGTPPLTRRASRLGGHRALVLGDAAGYIEPFTGEGMAWALASGAGVAPFVKRAIARWDPDLITRWSIHYRGTVVRRQRVCRTVARCLRRPRLTRTLISVLNWIPALARPLIRYLNAPAFRSGSPLPSGERG
jgi:flavin-dependent dehydrogenase